MQGPRYQWSKAEWGEIPGIAFHRPRPTQPPITAGHMPISNTPCKACLRPMAQILVDHGEEYHVDCGPDRAPMAHTTMTITSTP